jgi:two-component system cell cycle response regulator
MSTETGSKQRLLIVDDSKVIRVTARKILRDHFDTIEAIDGENAWEVLNNEGPFSLIVSDLTMPNLDGFGLLDRIRSSRHPAIRDIPVIIITGANDSEATKSRASQAGATDFIGKPFDSVHLLARTQAHANARILTDALRQETFKLEEQSMVDPLTGLSNEIAFMERAYQQLSYAIRHKTDLSIFLVEIDGYLELGRQYGKPASEAMLRSVADTLKTEIRQEDTAARTGAARFGLLLPGMNMAGIRNLSERIIRSVTTTPVKQGEERIAMTVSIGVATPDIRRDTRLEDLLPEAAQHLSLARSQGGNQAVFTDAINAIAESGAPGTIDKAVISHEVIMEMVSGDNTTEIEIGVPLMFEAEENPADNLAITECKDKAQAAALPGRFAGPVSASPQVGQTGAPPGSGREPPSSVTGLAAPEPVAIRGKAAFATDDMDLELEETIIITAPFDVHYARDAEISRQAGSQDGTAGTDASESHISPVMRQEKAETKRSKNHQAVSKAPSRKGFFRRMFGAITSPFRSRKPA